MTNYTIYRLFDYESGLYVGAEFSDLREFFDHHKEHTFKELLPKWGAQAFFEPRTRLFSHRGTRWDFYVAPRKPGMFQNQYSVRDELGRNYPNASDLWELAYPRKPRGGPYYAEYDDERIMQLPKNNVDKMVREVWSWYFRGFRTTNERRQNEAHMNEYGPEYGPLVRRSRLGYNLPQVWDDLPNSKWATRKSWKHNSKRRHQWKTKTVAE